jgi:poly-gamma-glutamate synthase PgsB/CapB
VTVDELLALQPPLLRAVGRNAAAAVLARVGAGRSLAQAADDALNERAHRRREAASSETDSSARERHLIAGAGLEMQALCAFAATGTADSESSQRTLVAVRLVQDDSWRLVQSGFDGLMADHAAGRIVPAAAAHRARNLAADVGAPVWSQVAALRFLAATAGRLAGAILKHRLTPRPSPDDLFVRAAAAQILCDVDPAAARLALIGVAADPSEYVRIEVCGLWARLGDVASLRARLDPQVEPSPRVRAAAAVAVAALEPMTLARVLTTEPHETPCRAALEEAERHLAAAPALLPAIKALAAEGPTGLLRRLAAETLERIHHKTDPEATAALTLIETAARALQPGQAQPMMAPLSERALGRALAVAAAGDHALTLQRRAAGHWRLFRGDHRVRRLWRILHELRSPSGEKRQSHRHTVGRLIRGHLRAASGILAEVSPTPVPGERLLVPALGEWGRHLPTVDDLLNRPAGGRALVFSSFGVTTIDYPSRAAWPRTVLGLHRDYATLAGLRQRALSGDEPRERRAYADALFTRGLRLAFEAHRPEASPHEIWDLFPSVSGAGAQRRSAVPAYGVLPLFDLVAQSLQLPRPAPHLLAVGVAAFGLMAARLHQTKHRLKQARDRIPLSIGGWGTRGKSGTERLKTALFQGLGCRVLAKTTGCEAVVLHAIPGVPAQEIYLYRPYDKATIWEQQEIVQLGAKLGVDVLLWECMALNPTYVRIVEGAWMRDDLCTITNAYPDHENIQGPAGIDVAEAISQFIPLGRPVFTAEEQMLPVLRSTADLRGAHLVSLNWRDDALLPDDLLARYPYQEHPRNIALVVKMAEAMGVPRAVALKEMADWVVPDLGVLKTYPEARWEGRRLQFSNGMSANERTGFLSNWTRLGFDDNGDRPGEWIVTVLNNRADRVSRSAAFAEIVVRDAAAHRHVLLGTNLAGLDKFIRDALDAFTRDLTLFDATDAHLGGAERINLALERARRVLIRLKLHELGPDRLHAEAIAMARGLGVAVMIDSAAFVPAMQAATGSLDEATRAARVALADGLRASLQTLGAFADAALDHLATLTAAHAAVDRWQRELRASAGDRQWRALEQKFRKLYGALFRATLVVIDDPASTGDQIIDRLARTVPPGFRARVMGAQNIKGTGLDFAYRWLAYEKTVIFANRLAAIAADSNATTTKPDAEVEAGALLDTLTARDDLGVLDLSLALQAVDDAGTHAPHWPALVAARATLAGQLEARTQALGQSATRASSPARQAATRVIDVFDGVRRRRKADRTLNALATGRLSQTIVAGIMRELIAQQKDR